VGLTGDDGLGGVRLSRAADLGDKLHTREIAVTTQQQQQ
jgi:hypothetical protein